MKDNALQKIYKHPEREELISKLTIGHTPAEVHKWLSERYAVIDKSLVLSTKLLAQFKDEYLDIYTQIRQDALVVQQPLEIQKEVSTLVQNNSIYRAKLEEYLDQEIDIKKIVKNLIVGIEFRAAQLFDKIQDNPSNTKMDYVLIQYMNSLVTVLEKYDAIINGGSDKIIQQNNINIQILDQHIGIFHKVIREVISRLDYDTSLLFVDILNEELKKTRPADVESISIDTRLSEARKLENNLFSLDLPTS